MELRRLKPVDLSASYERYSADRCESKPRHWDFVVTDNIQAFDLEHQLSATFVLVVKTLNEDEAEGGIPDFVTIAMKTSQNEQLTLLKVHIVLLSSPTYDPPGGANKCYNADFRKNWMSRPRSRL